MEVVAQLVRAPDCGSGGRGFETRLPPQKKKAFCASRMLFSFPSKLTLFAHTIPDAFFFSVSLEY